MKDSIIEPPISELLKRVENKFSLVILTARVARRMIDEQRDNKDDQIKPLTQAIRKVNDGEISCKLIECSSKEDY